MCVRDIEFSDFHYMACFATKAFLPRSEKSKIFYRSYKHFNIESYRQDIRAIPFHVSEVFDSVDDPYWFCHELLTDVINCHALRKNRVVKRKQLPYMIDELRRAMYAKI